MNCRICNVINALTLRSCRRAETNVTCTSFRVDDVEVDWSATAVFQKTCRTTVPFSEMIAPLKSKNLRGQLQNRQTHRCCRLQR